METSPFMQEVLNIVIPAVVSLLGLAVTAATGYATAWLRSKVKSERIGQALGKLQDVVADAVAEAEQTAVKAAKAGAKDGKLSIEDAMAVRDRVVGVVRRHLGTAGMNAAGSLLGVVDDGRIRTMVEAEILSKK